MSHPRRADPDPREACLHALLEATEALCAALVEGDGPEAWLVELARRERAFEALERACAGVSSATQVLSSEGRAVLARIAALDARLIADGSEALVRLQGERLALVRRRRAVAAHGLQERGPARAVTVKA